MFLCGSQLAHAQDIRFPVITGYGGVAPVNVDVDVVDTSAAHNIVAELVSPAASNDAPHQYLQMVARWVNLFAHNGVPRKRLHIVVVAHGEGAYALLNDAAYRTRYGKDNPNTELLQKLAEAGVDMLFCGQTMAIRSITREELAPQCRVVLGMVTAVVPYQLKGYAYIKL